MSKTQQVLFIGKGRLGNQIFQWVALRKAFPESVLWAPSLGSLPAVFETGDGLKTVVPNRVIDRLLRRKLGRLTMRGLFKHLCIGGYAWESTPGLNSDEDSAGSLLEIRSADRKLIFVDGGYYQNLENLLEPGDFQELSVHSMLLRKAREQIQMAIGNQPWPRIVLHVRRTDYVHFRPYGLQDVTLPVTYYERAAATLRDRFGSDAPLLIVTDDVEWCRKELIGLEPFHVISSTEAVDFAALSIFPGVAISNSTFSLAAACVSRAVECIVAPEFWFGRQLKTWYPPHIRTNDQRFIYF